MKSSTTAHTYEECNLTRILNYNLCPKLENKTSIFHIAFKGMWCYAHILSTSILVHPACPSQQLLGTYFVYI